MLAMVGLVGFAALAIDGGRLYAEARHAQNAADNAALAAARAMCLDEDHTSAGLQLANENGYDNDGIGDIVTVNSPPTAGPYSGNSDYVEVTIVSNFPATLIQFFRPGGLQVTVRAVSKCNPGESHGQPAVYAGSETCNNALRWSGSDSTVEGGLHSNNDVQVTGNDNSLTGLATYVTTIDADPDKVTFDPPPPDNPVQSEMMEDPLGFDLADYAPGGSKAAIAQGEGMYRYCDGDIDMNWLEDNHYFDDATDTILDGLYYATGDIDIGGTVTGNAVTFVAEGDIHLRGPDPTLSAYMDGLLVFAGEEYENGNHACNTAVIKLSLSGGTYEGMLYAPHGNIDISGSGIQIAGGLIGYSINLSGHNLSLINSSAYIPSEPGTIEITE